MNQHKPAKKYLSTWCIMGYYQYHIFEIDAGKEKWYEASPTMKGVTRIAATEEELRAILTKDAKQIAEFWAKVR